MAPTALELSDINFRWSGRKRFSLSVPNLAIETGDSVLLLGDSGSGKSTLLSLICGIVLPATGSVQIEGQDLTNMSATARDRRRAEKIGVIFQQFNLLPFGTVADNIKLPLHFAPERNKRVSNPPESVRGLCTALGLPASIVTQKASTLSVGQQQRVAVARALIGQPPLIVADEPTSALDETNKSAFLDLLFEQTTKNGSTLLMVSHDPRLATRFQRVLHMRDIATVEGDDP